MSLKQKKEIYPNYKMEAQHSHITYHWSKGTSQACLSEPLINQTKPMHVMILLDLQRVSLSSNKMGRYSTT